MKKCRESENVLTLIGKDLKVMGVRVNNILKNAAKDIFSCKNAF